MAFKSLATVLQPADGDGLPQAVDLRGLAKTAKSSRRLFDANDWESTGIVRFRPELLDDQ